VKVKTIAKHLERTEIAILVKAKRLHLSNTKNMQGDFSLGELASIIGKDRRTILNWIRKGEFPAFKRVSRRERAFYFVRPEEFWKWAFQNREKLNFSRIPPHAIPPEPIWVKKERKQNQKIERNYKPWTTGEIKDLFDYSQKGFTHSQIAQELDRSAYSVERKLSRVKDTLNSFIQS
jgi:DNA-directed RNA polymerase specialized sigma24 family protein